MDLVNLVKDIIPATFEPCSPCSTCTGVRHPLGIASCAEAKTPTRSYKWLKPLKLSVRDSSLKFKKVIITSRSFVFSADST